MLKVEKKISFVVAGIDFENLKTAQFFARAVNLHNNDNDFDSALASARDLLETWAAATHEECDDEELVKVVMGLQLPKVPLKKKVPEVKDPVAHAERVNAQREALDNPPGWNEEYYGSPVEDDIKAGLTD